VVRLLIAVLIGILVSFQGAFAGQTSEISQQQVTALVTAAQRNVSDPRDWAIDLLDVLRLHDLSATRENICSSIAIIAQESGFQADPPVAGLGKISEQAIRGKLDGIPILGQTALNFLETSPSPKDSYMERIRSARTERDLDMTSALSSKADFSTR
jgi:hypothetical protein